MVVISIILILVAVSVVGISQVSKHTKAQRTQTALESARSIWAGYLSSDGTQAAIKAMYKIENDTPILPAPGFTNDLDATGTLPAGKGVNGEHVWSKIRVDTTVGRDVDYTARAMTIFLRVRENRDIMGKLPADAKFLLMKDDGVTPLDNCPPLLADGNGEPILFIPPAGLNGVRVAGGNAGIIQADGRWHPSDTTPDLVVNITRTPFFASAGSDRSFITGDDNAYSVHQ